MSVLEALLLGIVQGLTEFLPISSSGHLILVPWLLDFHYLEEHPDFNKTFDVALHAGTLVAVLFYFRSEIGELLRGALSSLRRRAIETPAERLAWLIALATVPAAAVGAVGEKTIEDHLGEPWQIALFMAGFALLLGAADRRPQRHGMEGIGWRSALAIGFAQVLALAPGTSRSGITITAARGLEMTRDAAARFSFLLLAPVVAGASIYEGVDLIGKGLPPGSAGPFAVGMVAAGVSGFLTIATLLRYVRRHDYGVFVWFRLAVALVVALLIATGLKPATF